MLALAAALISPALTLQAQTKQWSKVATLPEGGVIQDIASTNDGTVYVLAGFSSDIYYTTDNGQTWNEVVGTESFWNTLDIEVDKVSKRLYVGTSSEGVWWTSDYGANWGQEYIRTDPTSGLHASFQELAVKHGTGTVVGFEGVIFPPGLTYVSTNSGNSWTTYQSSNLVSVQDMEYTASGELLAAGENGVFKSTNNGSSWASISPSLSHIVMNAVAHKASNGYIFAGGIYNTNTQNFSGAGMYVSADGGATWTLSNTGLTNFHIKGITVDNGSGNVYVATEGGVFMSTNNGSSWTSISTNLQGLNICGVAITSAGFFNGSSRTGVAFSTNPANGWTYVNNELYINTIQSMVMQNGSFHMVDGDFSGVHSKSLTAAAWQQTSINQLPEYGGNKMAKDNNGNIYVAFGTHVTLTSIGAKNGVFKSADDGATWTDISNTIPTPTTPDLRYVRYTDIEISGNGTIYVMAYYGSLTPLPVMQEIFRSTDGGATWTSIDQSYPMDIDVAPNGNVYLTYLPTFAVDKIKVSTDNGATFTPISVGSIFLSERMQLVVDNNNDIYLVDYNKIHKLVGGNWTQLAIGNWSTDANSHPIRLYFDNQNKMYVAGLDDGVYYSDNNGSSWTDISNGMPIYNSVFGPTRITLTDLQFDSNNIPYARTADEEGGNILGIYKLSITSGIGNTQANGNTNFNLYPNPVTTTMTLTFDAPASGSYTAGIYDITGKLVKSWPAQTATAGINTLTLDCADLASGAYLLSVTGDGVRIHQSVIKQ